MPAPSLVHPEPVLCIGGFSPEQLMQTHQAGFSLVEVGFSEIAEKTDTELAEYTRLLRSLSLKPVASNGFFKTGLGAFFDGSLDLPAVRAYIARAFEASAAFGLHSIAFGSGFMRRVPEGYDRERAVYGFCDFLCTEVVPYLEKYNTHLNIEELQSAETNFINSCREAAQMASQVNSTHVGVLCDYYHMSLAGETAADVPHFASHIGHVHLASPSSRRSIPLPADGDETGYHAFFRALAQADYTGYISIEGGVAPERDFAATLAEGYIYTKSLLASYKGEEKQL